MALNIKNQTDLIFDIFDDTSSGRGAVHQYNAQHTIRVHYLNNNAVF